MTPNVDQRLASVVRALSEIIVPSLPEGAALAREQAQLAIGHLMILRGQMTKLRPYEERELAGAMALGEDICSLARGGASLGAAVKALKEGLKQRPADESLLACADRINGAICGVIRAAQIDGTPECRKKLSMLVVRREAQQALEDRAWFAPMGFDAEISQ